MIKEVISNCFFKKKKTKKIVQLIKFLIIKSKLPHH